MERETGIEPATFSLARRCSTTEPLPLVRYVCETKIAYQGRFVNNLIVRQSEETSHRDIFVNRFPMNAPALSNQFPLLALFISSVLQAWKPSKRGTNLTSIGKMHMETLRIKVTTPHGSKPGASGMTLMCRPTPIVRFNHRSEQGSKKLLYRSARVDVWVARAFA